MPIASASITTTYPDFQQQHMTRMFINCPYFSTACSASLFTTTINSRKPKLNSWMTDMSPNCPVYLNTVLTPQSQEFKQLGPGQQLNSFKSRSAFLRLLKPTGPGTKHELRKTIMMSNFFNCAQHYCLLDAG